MKTKKNKPIINEIVWIRDSFFSYVTLFMNKWSHAEKVVFTVAWGFSCIQYLILTLNYKIDIFHMNNF